jgi:hypothetical protein
LKTIIILFPFHISFIFFLIPIDLMIEDHQQLQAFSGIKIINRTCL